MTHFNDWLAGKITAAVSTMWCAYAFALLAVISLPDALRNGRAAVISWIAQTFLQLVLLSVIMVGQRVLSDQHDVLHDKVDALHQKIDDQAQVS